MAECGICLDVLRVPVSVPCGHVHCERCLRGHINSGTDALRSTCPTCRKPFHIATPDFTFVPQKYHDFILPSVRKIYMDIPSVTAMSKEIEALTRRLDGFIKENEHLRERCAHYRRGLEDMAGEKRVILENHAEARRDAVSLRKKYDTLKKRYWEALRDDACDSTPSQSLSRRSSQNFDSSSEILPKVEEHIVSLKDLSPHPHRPKRALPKSRLSQSTRCKVEPEVVKRQRTQRHSDVGSSRQLPVFKSEEDDEDEE